MMQRRQQVRSQFRGSTAALLAIGLLLTGCATGEPPGTRCEPPVRTAADIQKHVFVLEGTVACEEATAVMDDYYRALEQGKAPGMGGGGPVPIGNWVCSSGPATDPGTTCRTEDGRTIEA